MKKRKKGSMIFLRSVGDIRSAEILCWHLRSVWCYRINHIRLFHRFDLTVNIAWQLKSKFQLSSWLSRLSIVPG
jgi:hypothetical protein